VTPGHTELVEGFEDGLKFVMANDSFNSFHGVTGIEAALLDGLRGAKLDQLPGLDKPEGQFSVPDPAGSCLNPLFHEAVGHWFRGA
jgi:hypothetical protein